jgi:hypothetical protein
VIGIMPTPAVVSWPILGFDHHAGSKLSSENWPVFHWPLWSGTLLGRKLATMARE